MAVRGLKGRHIAVLLRAALLFYARHKSSLDPQLTAEGVAALEVLIGLLPVIEALNEPGPQ